MVSRKEAARSGNRQAGRPDLARRSKKNPAFNVCKIAPSAIQRKLALYPSSILEHKTETQLVPFCSPRLQAPLSLKIILRLPFGRRRMIFNHKHNETQRHPNGGNHLYFNVVILSYIYRVYKFSTSVKTDDKICAWV